MLKSKVFIVFIVCLASSHVCKAQQFINGGLEANIGTTCNVDISNATFNGLIKDVVGLGVVSKLDLITDQCGLGVPREGNYFIGLQAEEGKTDAIAIRVDQTLLSQQYYYLEFFARLGESDTPDYNLALGINSNANFHGELLFTARDIPQGWRRYEVFFRAPGAGQYITVLVESKGKTRIFVDGFKMICPPLDIGKDTVFCKTIEKTIDLPPYFRQSKWSNGVAGNSLTIRDAGTYSVETMFGDCILKDSITIMKDDGVCDCEFFLPNIIKASSLQSNGFRALGSCIPSSFQLTIYNRWGNVVFASNDSENVWNGPSQSETFDEGVYVCDLRYTLSNSENSPPVHKISTITVMAE